MSPEARSTTMDDATIMACVTHIRLAAKMCQDHGDLANWATLLGVVDQLLETVEIRAVERH